MITELNIKGKKRVAIVLDEYLDLDTIGSIRKGVLGALNAIALSQDAKDALTCEELYGLNHFLSLTEPTEFEKIPLECFADEE